MDWTHLIAFAAGFIAFPFGAALFKELTSQVG